MPAGLINLNFINFAQVKGVDSTWLKQDQMLLDDYFFIFKVPYTIKRAFKILSRPIT